MGIRSAPVPVKTVQTRGVAVAACVAAVVLSTPRLASAQRAAFFQGVAELADAAEGIYGDEGARIGPALDAMSRALDAWNRDSASESTPDVQAKRGLDEAAQGMPLVPLAAYRPGF